MDKAVFRKYRVEFAQARTGIVKSRLRLLCLLVLFIYSALTAISYLLNPAEFSKSEIFIWIFLLAAGGLSLFLNRGAKTLLAAELNSLGFVFSLIAAFLALFFIYPRYAPTSAGIFSVMMFAASFIIPWDILETAIIGAGHFAAYIALYLWPGAYPISGVRPPFTKAEFADGLMYLGVTLAFCAIIRKRDDDREKENFILMKELEAKNTQIEKELELAREIHKTLIPKSISTDKADIAVSYLPVSTVGGDYATFHMTKESNLFFLISDITGHGVPAALLVNRICGEVESLLRQNYTPGPLLKELDAFVQEHFKQTEMYLSACSGLLDFQNNKLFYSNYGHPPQILHQRRGNRICLLESQTFLLGIDSALSPPNVYEGSLSFERKDRIILFTDGLIETAGDNKQLYGIERLQAFVKGHTDENPRLFNSNLLKEVDGFRKGPVTDDIFLLTLDIK
jgi:serine phosphatase RsbU (regulator of sigma subunit)